MARPSPYAGSFVGAFATRHGTPSCCVTLATAPGGLVAGRLWLDDVGLDLRGGRTLRGGVAYAVVLDPSGRPIALTRMWARRMRLTLELDVVGRLPPVRLELNRVRRSGRRRRARRGGIVAPTVGVEE